MIHSSLIKIRANEYLHKIGEPPLSEREMAMTNALIELMNKREERAEAPRDYPTVEQVIARAAQINLPTNEARRFFDYYEANGWRIGKNPIRKWQSALGNWKRTYDERNASKGLGYAV